MALFLPMVDTILGETFVRESLPPQACCQSCRAPLQTPAASPLASSPVPPVSEASSHAPIPACPSIPVADLSALPISQAGVSLTSQETDVSASPSPTSSTSQGTDLKSPPVPHLYKCTMCEEFLECRSCCIKRHAYTPLHMLKVNLVIILCLKQN